MIQFIAARAVPFNGCSHLSYAEDEPGAAGVVESRTAAWGTSYVVPGVVEDVAVSVRWDGNEGSVAYETHELYEFVCCY